MGLLQLSGVLTSAWQSHRPPHENWHPVRRIHTQCEFRCDASSASSVVGSAGPKSVALVVRLAGIGQGFKEVDLV